VKKILIATPSYDGKVDVWYTSALHQTTLIGIEAGIYFHPVFMSYDALIQRSRNDLVALAVEQDFDGILWIDADIEWHPLGQLKSSTLTKTCLAFLASKSLSSKKLTTSKQSLNNLVKA